MKALPLLISSLLFVGLAHELNGQVLYQTNTELERRALASTTTYVQLIGDKDYDTRLREALATGWTLTRGIEFVEPGGSLGDPADERRSYISLWRLHITGSRSFLVLWQGGKMWSHPEGEDGNFSNADYGESWVVAVPIDCVGRETQDAFVAWRLPLAIHSMIQMVDYAHNEHPGTGRAGFDAGNMHGLATASLEHKKLLLWKGRFTDQEISMFRDHYSFPVETVDMDVILKAMDDHDPTCAVLVFAQGGNHQILSVHDAATHDLLYGSDEYDALGDYGLTPKMVKALARAVR